MKLLVLAQTPPPLHGQSVMVEALLKGLPPRGILVCHVNLRLSRDAADIGTLRPGKVGAALLGALRAILARFRSGSDTFYYVPAPPGKRGALYRDLMILLLCRPFFRHTVLHWHAPGLGEWLARDAHSIERVISHALLGHADLAIVLAGSLGSDAKRLRPRTVAIVHNGVADPGPPLPRAAAPAFHSFFLGLGGSEKGLFAAADAVLNANQRVGATEAGPSFVLTAAGPFDSNTSESRFRELCQSHPGTLRHIGAIDAQIKRAQFAASDALILPTRYAAEGFPLVALEALAHDRPVIATRWRGLSEIVTPDVGLLVPLDDPVALADALLQLRVCRPAPGVCRTRFEQCFTLGRHLDTLREALSSLD
jgi:glycosyltransferase involved in cell wall biosynthesis